MLNRRRAGENPFLARNMRKFFRDLHSTSRRGPTARLGADAEQVALAYASRFWDPSWHRLENRRKIKRTSFSIGLTTDSGDLGALTKRGVLVADTLVVSHDRECSRFHEVGSISREAVDPDRAPLGPPPGLMQAVHGGDPYRRILEQQAATRREHIGTFGIVCPDLAELGQWITDSEELLKQGLVWYLPVYVTRHTGGWRSYTDEDLIDHFVQDRRAITLSRAAPETSSLVRPILRVDLPFVDGVGLRDFSNITVNELHSYAGFRSFLRGRFLELDDALDDQQSQRALAKIGNEIGEGIRSVESQLHRAKSQRAVAVTGAAVGTVGAVLVAVYGPALATAVSLIGAGGGLWQLISALADGRQRILEQEHGPWYYVWLLDEASR